MKELDELEAEIDSLGAAWNQFGKTDRIKILIKQINNNLKKEQL